MKKILIFLVFVCLTACGTATQNTPKPSITAPKETATPSLSPTITPTATATIRPTASVTPELATYQDTEMKLQISYPKSWIEKSQGVFIGTDGYLIIKKLAQYNSPDLIHVAIDFVNSNYVPDQLNLGCAGWSYGCLIMDDAFRTGTGTGDEVENSKLVAVMPYDQGKDSAKYFSMEVTEKYYLLIETSIKLNGPTREPTPTAERISTLKPIKKRSAEGISIQELPLSKIDWYGDDYFFAKPINYQCGIDPSRKNNDFTMENDSYRININSKGKTIYRYISLLINDEPDSFCTWDDNWMFETHNMVVMNGKVLNHELGYDEIFSWHLLDDKPTFFVKNKGKYQISFDGKLIPFAYDEIIHDWCIGEFCMVVTNDKNPRTDGVKTWFKARRDNAWFMVVVSVN